MIRARAALAAVAALAVSLGCPGDEGGVGNVLVVASVEVTPGITTVILGSTSQLTAAPKTASGLPVPGRSVTWSSTDPAKASVSQTGLVTGVTLGGPVRIRATADGITGDALITVQPVPVNRIAVTPGDTPILVGGTVQLTATAFDAANAPLSGRSFLWESSAPATAAVTSTGVVIGQSEGGPVTITAITEGKSGSATVSVSTRPATRLAFATQPGPSTAGAPLNPQIRIALQDDLLTTVIGANNPVTIQLVGNPSGATLGGTLTASPTNGIATFGNLTINRVGAGYIFLVTSPGLLSATSVPFNVAVGLATQFTFTTAPPGAAQSGAPLASQPVLQLRDGSGNVVPQANVQVTATLASGTGTLAGTATAATNAQGVAAFTNLAIVGAAGSYSLGFGATGIATLVSGPIVLGAGAAAALSITTQPSQTAQNAVPLVQQPAVQLRDGVGNPVLQAGVVVTASLASGTGALGGGTSATTNASGLATFTSLAINGAAGVYTLRFSAPGSVTAVVSGPITLGAGAGSRVAVTVQPGSPAQAGIPFSPQPAVQIRDGSNNPVATPGVTITASASAGGTLLGLASATTDATGTATFASLALSGLVGPYTLTFSGPQLQDGISNTVTLTAGAASQLGITTQPSAGAASGVAFAQQPVLQVRDIPGNPVGTTPGVTVTAALASGPGGTLGGTPTATTTTAGVASFTNLAITGPSGGYTIRFTSPGLTQVVSNTVTLGSGGASIIAANSATTQSAVAGSAVAAPPSVVVLDASANPVAGVPVTFAVTAGGGTVVPAGPVTVLTNASGIATATSWTLGPVAGTNNNTVTASAPVPTGSPVTFTASGLVGPPAAIAGNSVTSQSATVSTTVASPPSVRVRDANNNPVQGVNVTFTLTAGGGSIVPATPAVVPTDALGIATLTSWTVGPLAGTNNNTLSATAAVPSGSPVLFTASGTAAGAGSIAANSSTSQIATVATAVAAAPSVRVTDALSNPVAGVNVTFTLTAGGGSISPASPAVIPTNGSGIATLTSWTLGTVAGTSNNTVTAAAAGVPGTVTFNASGTADAANTVAANSPTNQSAQAGTAVGAPPSVRITDQFGNPVNVFAVSFAVTSGGGGAVVPAAPATVLTNAAGIATATSWTLGPGVGANTVNATAAVPNGSPVVFTATGTAGGATNIAANSVTTQSAIAGTAVATPPSVRVTDASSNPVPGQAVTFTIVDGGNGSVGAPATVLTDGNGIATVTSWTLRTAAGTNNNTLHATSGTLLGSPVIFTASGTVGAPAMIIATSATSQSATVATAVGQAPSVRVTDINGNVVSAFAVTFTVATGGGTTVPASPAAANTNGSGIATLTSWTLGTVAGTSNNSVTATGTGLGTVTFTASGAAAAANTIAANSVITQSATAGSAVGAPPSVLVTDTFGNPVPSAAVTFTVTAGGGATSPASPATISTSPTGVATLTSWMLGATVGTNNNTVSATAAVANGSPVVFTASGTAGTASLIVAQSATSQSATVATAVAAAPSVKVTDANGNAVSSFPVTFTLTAGGGSIAPASAATVSTDGLGIATLTSWTLGTVAGANNNTVTATGTGLGTVTFTASGTAAAAANIAANSAITQSTEINTNVADPPSVLVTDTHGNPVSSFAVTFTLTAGGGSIAPASPASVSTNLAGVATLTSWTLGPAVGTNNNTVGASGVGAPLTFNASGTAGAAANFAANSVTTQSANAGTIVATPPSVKVTDANGNPVQSTPVTFTLTTGGSIVPASPATVNTDALGVATLTSWTLDATAGNPNSVTAASGTLIGSPVTFTATGTVGPAAIMTANSVTSQSATVATAAVPPSVKVTDAHNNPVVGFGVTFTVTAAATGGSISPSSPATVPTDGSGIATLTSWTLGTAAGTNNNTVSASGVGAPLTFDASGVAGSATTITANSVTTQNANAGTAAVPPSVKVTDTHGNPVQSTSVTFTLATAGSIVPASPATISTDASGIASLTSWTLDPVAGNPNTVTAASGTLGGSPVTFNATGTAGAPAVIVITQQPGPPLPILGTLSTQPSVQVRDAFGNGVAGALVTASLESGAGSLTGMVSLVTDVNGILAYTDLGISGPGLGNHSLRFTTTGGIFVVSPPF